MIIGIKCFGVDVVLENIISPLELHKFTLPELEQLAAEIRRLILSTVSKTGGHLAPSLGTVELTLALFSVFDLEHDKLVWDVGHQAEKNSVPSEPSAASAASLNAPNRSMTPSESGTPRLRSPPRSGF